MLAKPASLLDRDREWNALCSLLESSRAELGLILGRRRVGKSFTLAPFADAAEGVYYQATRRSEAEQMESLTGVLAERFGDPALRHGGPFRGWESMFRYLVERSAGRPFVLVLDEYPYLEDSAPGLSSIVQSLVDHRLGATRFKLFLCGSHVSAMKRLEGPDQPLYGRRTRRIDFAPFGCREAALFLPGYTARQALAAFGVFGGLPGQLALLDPKVDLATNVRTQILDPGARLFDEAQHVLDAFLADAEVHYSIVDAIARGDEKWSGIAGRVGTSAGSLSRPMRWLQEMRLVDRVVPITESNPSKSKRAVYRIVDPHLRFWHRFVSPLLVSGAASRLSPAKLWKNHVAPGLDAHMGPVFEQACREHVARGAGLPFEPARVGEWWSADSRHQIDVVALSDSGEVLVGECKWGGVSRRDVAALDAATHQLLHELGDSTRQVSRAIFTGQELTSVSDRKAIQAAGALLFTAPDLLGR